ncbi:hypothetical protein ACOPJQ_12400 [Luteimonas dalianensis]|uniref:hypothetical protein n=1 Tax=Luteimonas dalianensis TaxID=1148196 RepID=UPI003BF2A777
MTSKQHDTTVYPISGWDTGPISGRDAIAIRIKYMDVETQQPAETRFFGIPRSEVGKLIDSLSQALAKSEGSSGES